MAAQNGQPKQGWPQTTITFVGDEELECWLNEFSERRFGANGRSKLIRHILGKYRAMLARKRPKLAKSSLQKQAILSREGES